MCVTVVMGLRAPFRIAILYSFLPFCDDSSMTCRGSRVGTFESSFLQIAWAGVIFMWGFGTRDPAVQIKFEVIPLPDCIDRRDFNDVPWAHMPSSSTNMISSDFYIILYGFYMILYGFHMVLHEFLMILYAFLYGFILFVCDFIVTILMIFVISFILIIFLIIIFIFTVLVV